MSSSFLARISGWAGIQHSQREASVIQLCSNIQNYKLSPSALEVPKKKDYMKTKTDSLVRVTVEKKIVEATADLRNWVGKNYAELFQQSQQIWKQF